MLLIVLNLPLVGVWVKLLQVPYRILYPVILFFCCIGVYSINNSAFDVYISVGFGLLGYLFIKLGFEPTPLLLGFILGPMMEENLKRALILSAGSLEPFYQRPISLTLLVLTAGMLLLMALPSFKRTRETALQTD